jgi:hypothetical protein
MKKIFITISILVLFNNLSFSQIKENDILIEVYPDEISKDEKYKNINISIINNSQVCIGTPINNFYFRNLTNGGSFVWIFPSTLPNIISLVNKDTNIFFDADGTFGNTFVEYPEIAAIFPKDTVVFQINILSPLDSIFSQKNIVLYCNLLFCETSSLYEISEYRGIKERLINNLHFDKKYMIELFDITKKRNEILNELNTTEILVFKNLFNLRANSRDPISH